MSDSDINTLNKIPAKRLNPLTNENGDPTTQMSSNKLRKIVKEEKDLVWGGMPINNIFEFYCVWCLVTFFDVYAFLIVLPKT